MQDTDLQFGPAVVGSKAFWDLDFECFETQVNQNVRDIRVLVTGTFGRLLLLLYAKLWGLEINIMPSLATQQSQSCTRKAY